MKRQENRKELLTYANIRRDLRRKLWLHWAMAAVTVLLSVLLVDLLFADPALLFETSPRYPWPDWLWLLVYPILVYWCIKDAWLVACGFRRRPYMARDTLHASEGDRYFSRVSSRTYYCTLHFNGYGDYKVPMNNYPWSKEYAMTTRGVHNTSFDGDEFYLVLSRPHSGKVLLAYPAKYFVLEGENPTVE